MFSPIEWCPLSTCYGQFIFAIPVTFLVIWLICETGMLGSAGAVASIVTIPVNPLHWARPLASMLGPVDWAADIDMGVGMGMGVAVGIGVADMNGGFPTLQSTGGDITVVGAMLNVAVAVN